MGRGQGISGDLGLGVPGNREGRGETGGLPEEATRAEAGDGDGEAEAALELGSLPASRRPPRASLAVFQIMATEEEGQALKYVGRGIRPGCLQ